MTDLSDTMVDLRNEVALATARDIDVDASVAIEGGLTVWWDRGA